MAEDRVRVRVAEARDVSFIIDSIRALGDYEKLSDQVQASAEELARHLFGQPRFAEALIGEYGGRSVGYALFFHSYSTFLTQPGIFLEDLFVVPEERGRGVGRAMLERVAAIAVERGCGRLEWAVLDWNEPALAFYRALGATPVDGWTTYRLAGAALHQVGIRSSGDPGR